jgi:hypothetical protein
LREEVVGEKEKRRAEMEDNEYNGIYPSSGGAPAGATGTRDV